VKDLVDETGLTPASLYNAFGDKRALFRAALDHYVDTSVGERIKRCKALPPRDAIEAFFADILKRSLTDPDHKGCLLVNSALELAPHDPEFADTIAATLRHIERFFLECVKAGQADATVTSRMSASTLAQHLLGVLLGLRVLARVRPEATLLHGVVKPALALLERLD
jgi:TetR/AcrR family transcriptional regulator, transcriptional repressor for nem operon